MTFIRIYFLFSCKSFNLWTNSRVSIWQLQWDELPKQNPGSVRKGAEEKGRIHKSLLHLHLFQLRDRASPLTESVHHQIAPRSITFLKETQKFSLPCLPKQQPLPSSAVIAPFLLVPSSPKLSQSVLHMAEEVIAQRFH